MKRIKKQDIPVVASILCEAYIRNKTDFINFSSVFDGTYEADMQAAIQAVKDRRRPADALDKQKMVTNKLYEKLDEMQEVLRLLGEYIKMAGDTLLTDYEFYHIKKARVALRLKNVEGVLEHCEQIIDKIVQDDAAALAVVGFDAGKLAEFEALHLEMDDLNKEQVHKVNERQDLKEIEEALFEAMYVYVDRISSVGKAMYTYKSKQKYSDFSVNKILGQINHGRKKQVEDDGSETETAAVYDVMIGRVTDKATDDSLEDVVVRIEGTSIMADTDSDGEFYIDEIPAGVYTVSFSKRGYGRMEQHNVEIGTETMIDLRVELLME
jgi:Carboxypeptidase regulatory-like domain